MAATATRRTRKAATPAAVPANLEGIVKETPAPAPKSVRPARRRPSTGVVKAEKIMADVLNSKAAPTLLGVDGSLTRHTQEYTVDLLEPGTETDRDLQKVMAKDPSETNMHFVKWVKDHIGYDADPKTVQILISTYHEFQASPEQKARTIAKRLAAAEKKAQKAASKKTTAAK